MIKRLTSKQIRGLLGASLLVITALFIGTRMVAGQSIGDLLGRSYAVGVGDTRSIAWVNDEVITRGQFIGLKEVLIQVEKTLPDQAPQEAINRLVRQKIIQLIAREKGLTPAAQEVEDRLALLYKQAAENPEMRAVLEPQAQAQGLAWDSEGFKALLRESLTRALAAEHLNQQVLEQAGGDAAAAREQVKELIAERYPSLHIRIEISNLPENARNVHTPSIEELNTSQSLKGELP